MIRILPSLCALLLLGACSASPGENQDGEHGHTHTVADAHAEGHGDEDAMRGEHGGRVLEQADIRVELGIVEDGTPPRFQAWLYRDGEALPAEAGAIEVRLVRLGGSEEVHALAAQADGRLMASSIVAEPHSFDVQVLVRVGGARLQWSYESYEGRTAIAPDIAADAGIRVQAAAPGEIADEHEVQGLLTPVEGRVATVMARFPGPIRQLRANVGDTVKAGQTLATIESNLSLSDYTVAAPIAGTVLSRRASLGSIAGEGAPLYEIADLSSLWVDLHVFGFDAQHIVAGAQVAVTRLSDGASARTAIERVLPGTATASQSTIARATLRNDDGQWRPGSAVRARITVQRKPAALVVPLSALQQFREQEVVFIRVGDVYEARPLQLGMRDAERVEVLSGLVEGDQVVVEQSYVVKADIEKSGASHDH